MFVVSSTAFILR